VRNDGSGCVITYVGLIRNTSHDKAVLSVEYQDSEGNAENVLREMASEAKERWQIEDVAAVHRVGKLKGR
jgi:molybdopterin synthase catalytic subunit